MKRDEFENLLRSWFNDTLEVTQRKGHDYATDDVLANFKRMHKVCKLYGVRPDKRIQDVFWFYVFIKIDRLRNLVCKEEAPENEAKDDSYGDWVNYIYLLRAIEEESKEK